jgi:hypothetical protein
MQLFKQNILRNYTDNLHKVVIWLTINSIVFITFLNILPENSFPNFDKQNDTFVTYTVQNTLEQNYNQRNFRYRNFDKFSFNNQIIKAQSQDLTEPNACQKIFIVKSFGSSFISSQNNHSLRSPPQFSQLFI